MFLNCKEHLTNPEYRYDFICSCAISPSIRYIAMTADLSQMKSEWSIIVGCKQMIAKYYLYLIGIIIISESCYWTLPFPEIIVPTRNLWCFAFPCSAPKWFFVRTGRISAQFGELIIFPPRTFSIPSCFVVAVSKEITSSWHGRSRRRHASSWDRWNSYFIVFLLDSFRLCFSYSRNDYRTEACQYCLLHNLHGNPFTWFQSIRNHTIRPGAWLIFLP